MTEKAQLQLLTKHLGHFNNVRLLSHSADLGTLPHKFSTNALSFNAYMCGRTDQRERERERGMGPSQVCGHNLIRTYTQEGMDM